MSFIFLADQTYKNHNKIGERALTPIISFYLVERDDILQNKYGSTDIPAKYTNQVKIELKGIGLNFRPSKQINKREQERQWRI